jgi:SAM-dependent methyltransferase
MSFRRATDVIAEHLDLDGARVVDVGSGAGGLVRWLRTQGADPVGIECGDVMRARAIEADPDHAEAHVDGVGQDLPLGDASADVVVFSYSLHHVPEPEMVNALSEAHRVLRYGGRLFVLEPVATGAGHEVVRMVDDETEVRAFAQAALDRAGGVGFELLVEDGFVSQAVYADFAAWEHDVVGVDPNRGTALAARREEIEARFNALGEPVEGGTSFAQPNVYRVFAK